MMLPLSSGADMITVPATDADIGDIVALVNSAYRGECRLDQRGRVACRTEDEIRPRLQWLSRRETAPCC